VVVHVYIRGGRVRACVRTHACACVCAGAYVRVCTGRAAAEGFDVAARPLDRTRVMRSRGECMGGCHGVGGVYGRTPPVTLLRVLACP